MQTLSNRTERKPEVERKLTRLRERMAERGADAIVLRQTANLAWITAGAGTYIFEATDFSPVTLIVTDDHAYVLTDTIEAPRLRHDEKLADLGFDFAVEPWYARGKMLSSIVADMRVAHDGPGGDLDMSADLQMLRMNLQPEEIARLRHTSKLAAETMNEAIRQTKPGDTEYALAARLAYSARARGGQPVVNLIASDDRIFQFRHPLPTAKSVERYAMLVLCLRYEGLIVSITRLIYFGKLPDDLRFKANACARVDARLILGTRPGRTLGDMFDLAKQAYTDEHFPEAIEEHHQGGSAGYLPREMVARPGDATPIAANQVFAWNPSIRGVKSEDTVLLKPDGIEVLTSIPDWPTMEVSVDGQIIARPLILEA